MFWDIHRIFAVYDDTLSLKKGRFSGAETGASLCHVL